MSEHDASQTIERRARAWAAWARLAAIALGTALALGACTGPGLEPPGDGDDRGGTGVNVIDPPGAGTGGLGPSSGASGGGGASGQGAGGGAGGASAEAGTGGAAAGNGGAGGDLTDAGVFDGGPDEDGGALR